MASPPLESRAIAAPQAGYVGRFAPSPTGALHAGSLVAALASWLDARAQGGRWLVRIEDIDTPRCVAGADAQILAQLAACGLSPDAPPVWQSKRGRLYQAALDLLLTQGWAYSCGCSRRDVETALQAQGLARPRHAERVYPGTCRDGLHGKPARAVRLLAAASTRRPLQPLVLRWSDRRLGGQHQNVSVEVGDFVLKRADGLWAYQLAVVADDAAQGVTHVVRGEDLADNTPRQIHLQHLLGLPTPVYMHTPLLLGADGEKLSKQDGALPLALDDPLAAVRAAGAVLGVQVDANDVATWLRRAVAQWRTRWVQ
jgi:glutamyl-Q tRNA(Asp) synthetase